MVFRDTTGRTSLSYLLDVPREIRKNISAHLFANLQDDLSSMLMVNHQLAAEYKQEAIFYHGLQLVADLHNRFPQLDFDIVLPRTDATWSKITTLTLSLPVSLRNMSNPIYLAIFLTELPKMLPFTHTLKVDLQPPQRLPKKTPDEKPDGFSQTPTQTIRHLRQHIATMLLDSDHQFGRKRLRRIIACWEQDADKTKLWKGLLGRLTGREMSRPGLLKTDDQEEDSGRGVGRVRKIGFVWRRV
jgi:hypothetical protein